MTPDADRGTTPARPPVSAAFCETVAASLLLLWRLWTLAPREWAQDILTIVALYWLLLRFTEKTKAWRPLTLLAMAAILAVYVVGRMPFLMGPKS